ncbi:precorrin-3B C(17)-methyltransferase [Pyxidicoccus fallax]|uniref:Precorrin-3B C(17)-methyltransferase n=1 Tax=Pyxidicoccus fallax TaxID=394095 RepID=A0A848LGK3_9BACT|nr:precorrin-3B C(17)-methyltransferase [Pyxidicoccus fallax]NMO16455.1 precorrin-3B C(17)-methyltransferase [Pyxidicoccus fallax]NPC79478.1 precorrin-3B C(17)-methyltransferase [Pyxidicoccus fallax]
MARVGRLAGALLAETQGEFFLVGDLKEPCDWASAGFEPPVQTPAVGTPFVRLQPVRAVEVPTPLLVLEVEGEPLAALLHERLVIHRNASVSERLWRLVTQGEAEPRTDARWLGQMPAAVWNVVRDGVLKCS